MRGEHGRGTLERMLAAAGAGVSGSPLPALVRVDVRMCGRGVPVEGAAVLLPSPADLRELPARGRRLAAPATAAGEDDGSSGSGDDDSGSRAPAGERQLAGYVTSGGLGARRGCGVGVGFVAAAALVDMVDAAPAPRGGAQAARRDVVVMIRAAGGVARPAWARPVF